MRTLTLFSILAAILLASCKKGPAPVVVPPTEDTPVVTPKAPLSIYIGRYTYFKINGTDTTQENHTCDIAFKRANSGGSNDTSYDVGNVWYGGVQFTKGGVSPYPTIYYVPNPATFISANYPVLQVEGSSEMDAISYVDNIPAPKCLNFPDTIHLGQGLHIYYENTAYCAITIDSIDSPFPGGNILHYTFTGTEAILNFTNDEKAKMPDSVYLKLWGQNRGVDNSNKYHLYSDKQHSYRKWVKVVN